MSSRVNVRRANLTDTGRKPEGWPTVLTWNLSSPAERKSHAFLMKMPPASVSYKARTTFVCLFITRRWISCSVPWKNASVQKSFRC